METVAIDINKVLSQIPSPASDSWDWRPTPECLSIRDVVNISRFGASVKNLMHLSLCQRDRRWLDNYAQLAVSLPAPAQSRPAALFNNIASWIRVAPQPQSSAVLLHVPGNGIEVADARSPISFEIAVVAGLPLNSHGSAIASGDIDLKSVQLAGALSAVGASKVERREIGPNLECLVFHFDQAELAGSPRKNIASHSSVSDSVRLCGRLSGDAKTSFCGQADVKLVQVSTRI